MATTFDNVYCQSQLLRRDGVLNNLPEPMYYSLNWRYLQYAISIFQYDCNPPTKITQYTPFQEIDYQFVGDGIDTDFLLSPTPLVNGQLWVGVRNDDENNGKYKALTEGIDYTFDNTTNIITFAQAPADLTDIWVASYIQGEFLADLSLREITILAEGMIIPLLEEYKNNRRISTSFVYGGSAKMFSPANLLDKNIGNADDQRKYVDGLIVEYSYKNYGWGNGGYVGLGGKR